MKTLRAAAVCGVVLVAACADYAQLAATRRCELEPSLCADAGAGGGSAGSGGGTAGAGGSAGAGGGSAGSGGGTAGAGGSAGAGGGSAGSGGTAGAGGSAGAGGGSAGSGGGTAGAGGSAGAGGGSAGSGGGTAGAGGSAGAGGGSAGSGGGTAGGGGSAGAGGGSAGSGGGTAGAGGAPFFIADGGPTLDGGLFTSIFRERQIFPAGVVAIGSGAAWIVGDADGGAFVEFLDADGGAQQVGLPILPSALTAVGPTELLVAGQATASSLGNNAYFVPRSGAVVGATLTELNYFPRALTVVQVDGGARLVVAGGPTNFSDQHRLYVTDTGRSPPYPMPVTVSLPCSAKPSLQATEGGVVLVGGGRGLACIGRGFVGTLEPASSGWSSLALEAQSVAAAGSVHYALVNEPDGGHTLRRDTGGGFQTWSADGTIVGATNGGPLVATPRHVFVVTTWNGATLTAGTTALGGFPAGQRVLVLQYDAASGQLQRFGVLGTGDESSPAAAAWAMGRLLITGSVRVGGVPRAFLAEILP